MRIKSVRIERLHIRLNLSHSLYQDIEQQLNLTEAQRSVMKPNQIVEAALRTWLDTTQQTPEVKPSD